MASTALWPVVGSLAAGAGTVGLMWALWDKRGRPGATWLLAVLGVQFVLTVGYGIGYFVFDPALRLVVEMLFWVAYIWLAALFVAFGLAYTGRGHIIRSPWFGTLAAFSLALTLLVVTNPLHTIVWEGFRVAPAQGLATVAFTRKGGALLVLGVSSLGASVGTLLLVDTIISYGKLYRAEALAVAISPLPPGIGFVLWTLDITPIPGLNVAPVLFLAHVAFDAYAFVGSGMFEFHPATRRTGNRAAIDDLGNPVVVVDDQHRVVNLNPTAEAMLDIDTQSALTRSFTDCYDGDPVDPTRDEQDVTIRTDTGRRVFKVTSTNLDDGTGRHLGYTLVFQDITDERQREQRLAVLNRVLRHNLRNDLTVVRMHVEEAIERGDDDTRAMLDPAESKIEALVELSEKARTFERVIADEDDSVVAVSEVVEAVVGESWETYPAATIAVEGADSALVRTNRSVLSVVLSNLLENALEHGTPDLDAEQDDEATADVAVTDGSSDDGTSSVADSIIDGATDAASEIGSTVTGPSVTNDGLADVTVSVAETDDAVTITISDSGPGIPEHELSVIEDGDESALEHGSGLGLWLVSWGVTTLGGELDFDTGDDGTTATVRLPVVGASE
jgi:signal transduction histidine kinase